MIVRSYHRRRLHTLRSLSESPREGRHRPTRNEDNQSPKPQASPTAGAFVISGAVTRPGRNPSRDRQRAQPDSGSRGPAGTAPSAESGAGQTIETLSRFSCIQAVASGGA